MSSLRPSFCSKYLSICRLKSDAKPLADTLDLEKIKSQRLEGKKEDLLKNLKEANYVAFELQKNIKDAGVDKLQAGLQSKGLVIEELNRIVTEKDREHKAWEEHCIKSVVVRKKGKTISQKLFERQTQPRMRFMRSSRWSSKTRVFPGHNMMIRSSRGAPTAFRIGFDLQHVQDGLYGRHLHLYDWPGGELRQTLDLGSTGLLPLEVRFFMTHQRTLAMLAVL